MPSADAAASDADHGATLSGSPSATPPGGDDASALARRQAAFGCSREEIELLLKPMIADGHEAVGSMGDDTPPAVLSSRARLLTDCFRQRFAQVTNPSVDPYRESAVMSLTTLIGGQGNFFDELAARPKRVVLRSPILTPRQLVQLQATVPLAPATIAIVCKVSDTLHIETTLRAIVDEACRAVEQGSALVVLTDRGVDANHAPLPALLATAAVHHALVDRGLRLRASLVVDTGDARDAHQLAVLFAYGASAVCPSLGLETIASLAVADPTGCNVATTRYRLALERGLRTLMSKMGVCTFSGYCGAQLFEILGLDTALVDRFFPGTPSSVGGVTLADIAASLLQRHRRAFADAPPVADYPGLHGYRRDGEYHSTNPLIVRGLQRAREEAVVCGAEVRRGAVPPAYDLFTSHVYGRPAAAIRDLIEFAPARAIALSEVESAGSICRRFFASAMSVGALSPEAHRTIAIAMNRLGARSNSGEGGEEQDRFGQVDGNRTKQVASARFGVTPAYLRSADELQIKIGQGSTPGEGGQLPGLKVVPHIARLRHAQPGTALMSPPAHHDVCSIDDLAELIHDLRAFHPGARINVKLVASIGVGIIAAGVAKAGAEAIHISGHDGGTGASPRASIKHAGMPWEIGLSEAHHALTRAGLRSRVVLQTDGGLKTGRDIAIAAALGAQEYGFGTAALVAIGCVMARQCHANTCPVGIATQRDDLRAQFTGTPDMLIGYLTLVAGEVRAILASLGLRRLDDLVGRADLLRRRQAIAPCVDLGSLLNRDSGSGIGDSQRTANTSANPTSQIAHRLGVTSEVLDTISAEHPLTVTGPIGNTDRAFGSGVAGAIAARVGDAGLPEGSVHMAMTGSAGQSFGAFSVPGMRLVLVGDANDGLAKGMHGGEIVVAPAARERGRARQVLVGNAALYGATGGRVFIAGSAGERFAVRNSGAIAVVEGVGDHACEYMTGGAVVVLGPIGRNFAAGMTGGVAYVSVARQTLAARTHPQQLAIDTPSATDQKFLRELLEAHESLTGSRIARRILRHDRLLGGFCKVTPAQAAIVAPIVEAEPVAVNQ
jgi:glutamate synthase (ferredoxin)